jgi:hypothetical protein
LNELQQLQEAGLLPGYAAEELSGLGLEELDEILVGRHRKCIQPIHHPANPSSKVVTVKVATVGVQRSPCLSTSLPHSGIRQLL